MTANKNTTIMFRVLFSSMILLTTATIPFCANARGKVEVSAIIAIKARRPEIITVSFNFIPCK